MITYIFGEEINRNKRFAWNSQVCFMNSIGIYFQNVLCIYFLELYIFGEISAFDNQILLSFDH